MVVDMVELPVVESVIMGSDELDPVVELARAVERTTTRRKATTNVFCIIVVDVCLVRAKKRGIIVMNDGIL